MLCDLIEIFYLAAILQEADEMPELDKEHQKTVDYIGAYDERSRTLEALRKPNLDPSQRAEAIEAYAKASAHFDKLRTEILKSGGSK